MANGIMRHDQENRREIRARQQRRYFKAAWYAVEHNLRKAQTEMALLVTDRGIKSSITLACNVRDISGDTDLLILAGTPVEIVSDEGEWLIVQAQGHTFAVYPGEITGG